ncbi:hypothetical protein NLJ89_g11560 [Agrocybe chaxingu]|uniref:Uncharacterized protein n=1 Tax=Agrocybe chaxingu TaxID=84603 RepID=A0A9W8MPW6_9AGAR|nr:hypothetical protein NLJ89_g11560 [Agrocybe chaxingu]
MDKERAPVLARPDSRGRDAHHVVSPLGRRSPPGSQIGRAKAARKSDEHLSREPPLPPPPTKESIHPVVELDVKKPKVKQELKPPRSRTTSDDTQPPAEEPRPPKKPVKEPAPPPPRDQPPPAKVQPDDAHEWFLHQYDEEPSPTTSSRPEPPHTPSPSVSPVAPAALQWPSSKS